MTLIGNRRAPKRTIVVAVVAVVAVVLGLGLGVSLAQVADAGAAVSPVVDRAASDVTADALPTVQIDGVAWSQAIVGNTVYVGGKFTHARPAGAPRERASRPAATCWPTNLTSEN
ncbi:hypothetical protein [uncultured Jatrophihabitans sp.]|uniref:hypothetical protein n=1 Tax=uncultured Jatrophihabitans sp. TaxID=1610747 RepID=UPI0035C9F493